MESFLEKIKSSLTFKLIFTATMVLLFSYSNLIHTKDIHILLEGFTLIVGVSTLIICINTYKISSNEFFTFLGFGYGCVVIFDFFYLLTFSKNSIIFTMGMDAMLSFWTSARYLEALTFVYAFKLIGKKINYNKVFTIYYGFLLIDLCLSFNKISLYYISRKFFKVNQLIIFVLFLMGLVFLTKNKRFFDKKDFIIINVYVITNILCQIIFVLSLDKFSNINDILNFISTVSIYYVIVKHSLTNPFKNIFKGLNDKNDMMISINKELCSRNEELKKAKKDLEKSSDRYKNLLSCLPNAVIRIKDGHINYINKEALNLFEATDYMDLVGKHIHTIIHEESKNLVDNRIDMLSSNYEHLPIVEEKMVTLKGKIIDVEVTSIKHVYDNEVYIIGVLRDLTYRKQMEETQGRLMKSLAEERIKIELFSNISHELKTPINVIYSALQLQNIYTDKEDIYQIRKYNGVVKVNCLRLLRMVDNLLDKTTIETRCYKLIIRNYDIVPVVEDIVMEVSNYLKPYNIEVIFDTDIEEMIIPCDKHMVERIILNLLSNAVKFDENKKDINVDIKDYKDSIKICVKDKGIGIPIDKREEIFKNLNRVDKSLRRNVEGTGMGLSIVKGFVELLKGDINIVSNESSSGSEFIVTLYKDSFILEHEDKIAVIEDRNLKEKVEIEFSDIYL
ncbi:MASE3 domain-containing protein [Clostridium sp.]|uniref:MASE3 domain-containing sensor histidine kinase n=1 Tax=Clostridium sp. TaxID=1506 RepID=UPI003464ADCA